MKQTFEGDYKSLLPEPLIGGTIAMIYLYYY